MKPLKNCCKLLAIFVLTVAFSCGTALSGDGTAKKTYEKTVKAPYEKTADKPAKREPEKKTGAKLTVYYFHGYARCPSCRKIEQYTREAAESFVSGAYAGRVVFSALNVEEGGNEHFIKDYQLVSKAVILQREKDGKPGAWENLDRIWLELGDKDKFIAYVKEHIVKQLEAK
ncbi:MAG TPA: nitrophenyl compound nitroreductase subunit ArsF family protein [Elusimicrobiales bacterium]|nr:nitrophenyl compound nitroreductase subunit ArsF family protein [Elusimicrobiales bacterium]